MTAKTTAQKTADASQTTAEPKPKATRATKATASSASQMATVTPVIEAADSSTADANQVPQEKVLVTVQQELFTKAIATAHGAIPLVQGHTSLLDRLRLTTDQAKQTLTVTGFNLIVGLEVSLPANVEGSGDWTVSASRLLRLLQNFPTGAVTLSWALGGTMTIVSKTAGPFEVATRLADDCPTIPVPEAPQSFALTNLYWGLKCAILCAGTEDSRCVHMKFWSPTKTDKGADSPLKAGVTLTSTKKEVVLSFYYDVEAGTDLNLPDRTVSVAGESLQKLVALLEGQQCQVELDTVSTEDVVVRFRLSSAKGLIGTESADRTVTTFTCRTDKVEAPNGNDFMPPDSLPVEISIDRGQLVRALYRQAVIADKQAAVALIVSGDDVTLTAEGAGVGHGTDTLSAQVKGQPMTIKFVPELLLECLQALQSNQARLGFSGPTDPAYIRDSEKATLFFVLAPAG